MQKTSTGLATPLREQLDRLAAFEPGNAPVLSLYLDMRPDQHGRDSYSSFVRKVFGDRVRALEGEARRSFERDVERIGTYLENVSASANGLALFACATRDDFFEVIQLEVPIDQHWLFIGAVPHLYPLARLNDQFPRYAALLVDTNSARLFVFALGVAEREQQVSNVKTRGTSSGGTSQARYQRHNDNFHLHHMKEVVSMLDRVVRDEEITRIVVSCDEVSKPILMEQLPRHLAEKIVDVVRLGIHAPEREVLVETLDALRERDAQTDAEQVRRMLDAWRANGLAVVGPEATLNAFVNGQVEELIITASPAKLERAASVPEGSTPAPVDVDTTSPLGELDPERLKLANELVARAQQTAARIRFVEDADRLSEVGGVGALLRFKI